MTLAEHMAQCEQMALLYGRDVPLAWVDPATLARRDVVVQTGFLPAPGGVFVALVPLAAVTD